MIKGEKINLRALEIDDAAFYHRFINDDESNYTRGLFHPISLKEAQAYIEKEMIHSSDKLTFVVLDGSDNIGFIGIRNICERSGRAELWIYIGDKSRWKQGFGSDAIKTLCEYGFESMNLHRIWLECDPGYPKIMNSYQKIGFVLEGTLRQSYYRRGTYRDTCIMGYLRGDWESSRKPGGNQ